MDTNKQAFIFGGIILLLIVAIVTIFTYYSQSKSSVQIKLGNNSFAVDLDNQKTDAKTILKELFNGDDRSRETLALLKEFHDVYHIKDDTLVHRLEQLENDSVPSVGLRQLLEKLRGPFERDLHTFYNIHEKSIVEAIEKLGVDHPVSKALRELEFYAKGPWGEEAVLVQLSVPKGNRIPKGKGASCRSSDFFSREVTILNMQQNRMVDIMITGSFPCPKIKGQKNKKLQNLIQLSYSDMKKVMGDVPILKVQSGLVMLANK